MAEGGGAGAGGALAAGALGVRLAVALALTTGALATLAAFDFALTGINVVLTRTRSLHSSLKAAMLPTRPLHNSLASATDKRKQSVAAGGGGGTASWTRWWESCRVQSQSASSEIKKNTYNIYTPIYIYIYMYVCISGEKDIRIYLYV